MLTAWLEGMSTSAVGAILGVGVGTVHRDLNSTVPNGTVAPREVMGIDGRVRTGRDGVQLYHLLQLNNE